MSSTVSQAEYRFTTAPVRGGELAVGVWGPETAEHTVLVVHGVTASHQSWPLVADRLEGVRVIAPDLRGRGRSNDLPGPYGMPQHTNDLAAVLDHLGVRRTLVVGHSMGAFVSVVFAHRHPERVSELILVDGGLPLSVPEGMSPDDFTRAVLGPAQDRLSMTFASHEEYTAFWRRHPAFTGDSWNDAVENYVAYDLQGEEGALHPATAFQAVAEDSAELTGSDSVMSAITALAHPTVFLRAPRGLLDAEPLYTVGDATAWAARIPKLTTIEVDDVNHYTIILGERGADAVTAVVQDALARAGRTEGIGA